MPDVCLTRTVRMLDDPDLTGDLLLVGIGFARFLDFGAPDGEKLNTNAVARIVFPADRGPYRKIKRVLADDARTYLPPMPTWVEHRCDAPMIRRDGPCGKPATSGGHVTDWTTGEATYIQACSRHRDWAHRLWIANRQAKPERLVTPAANHGGVLARHIPEFGWPKIWAWASDGRWKEHPEVEPWRPPTLTLHLGDGDAPGVAPSRGALALASYRDRPDLQA